jgi:capsular polysaccharide biosynthesis protein
MSLFDYLKMIRNRLTLIISIIIVVCAFAGVLSSQYSRPVYQASSKIIVNKTNEVDGQPLIDQGNLAVNIMLINTYKELIKTPPILERVIELHPELNVSMNELVRILKVTTVMGSQIMTISVQDTSYARASAIVNALTNVFKSEIPLIMRVENVEILSQANAANQSAPQETGLVYVLLISFIVSTTLALLIAFLLESFDRRMREAEDVEKLLGIPVMANVAEIKKKHLKKIKSITSFRRVGDEKHVHVHS